MCEAMGRGKGGCSVLVEYFLLKQKTEVFCAKGKEGNVMDLFWGEEGRGMLCAE